MNAKAKLKIVLDVAMTLALLFLMGYPWWGDVAHEWAGAGMFALFIAHHILNAGWWRSLGKGRYIPARIFQLVIDLLVLLAMLGLMVSGVMLSNHVFAFLPISGGMSFARLLHMASAYWGFVLMSLHLELHWNMILGMARRAAGDKPAGRTRRIAGNVIGAAVAVYGLVAFVRRGLPMYLFVQTHFVFFDYSEPIPLFYLDYLAMMGACIFLAHWAGRQFVFLSFPDMHNDCKQNKQTRSVPTMKKNIGHSAALYPAPPVVVGTRVNGRPTYQYLRTGEVIAPCMSFGKQEQKG